MAERSVPGINSGEIRGGGCKPQEYPKKGLKIVPSPRLRRRFGYRWLIWNLSPPIQPGQRSSWGLSPPSGTDSEQRREAEGFGGNSGSRIIALLSTEVRSVAAPAPSMVSTQGRRIPYRLHLSGCDLVVGAALFDECQDFAVA